MPSTKSPQFKVSPSQKSTKSHFSSLSTISNTNKTGNSTTNPLSKIFHLFGLSPLLTYVIIAAILLVLLIIFCCCCYCCCCKGKRKKRYIKRYEKEGLDEKEIEFILSNMEKYGSSSGYGRLDITLKYMSNREKMSIKIVRAEHLPTPIDGSLDSYVVFNYGKQSFKTKIRKNTEVPIFNEKFVFNLPLDQLDKGEIYFKIMDYDKFGEDALLGQKLLQLSTIDKGSMVNQYHEMTLFMEPGEDTGSGMGQVCVILNNSITKGLQVTILEAKNLRIKENSFYSSVYISLTFKTPCSSSDNKKYHNKYKKKTEELKLTKFPYFNQKFCFKNPSGNVTNSKLVLKVYMSGMVRLPLCIGSVTLGLSSKSSSGVVHWNAMLDNPRHATAKWHILCNPRLAEK